MYFILYIWATNYNYIILSVNGMINIFEVTLYLSLDVSTFKYQRYFDNIAIYFCYGIFSVILQYCIVS